MTALFTFILDYRGGTYIRQMAGRSLKRAIQEWAESLQASEIYRLGNSGKQDLVSALNDEQPIPIEGVQNVWCFSVVARGQLALINIVKTEPASKAQ